MRTAVLAFALALLMFRPAGASPALWQDLASGHGERVAILRDAAMTGHPHACYHLGSLLIAGSGVPRDLRAARTWFRAGADLGHAGSREALGMMLLHGLGGPKDPLSARAWLEKAALQGALPAQFQCGLLALAGIGVPDQIGRGQARFWWKTAAEGGFAPAEPALFAMDRLPVADDAGARRSYRRAMEDAALRGDSVARELLAALLLIGFGGTDDPREARRVLASAAGTPEPRSLPRVRIRFHLWALDRLLSASEGLPDVGMEQAPGLVEAAEAGYPPAQFHLGIAFYRSGGGPRSREKAAEWLEKALAGGVAAAGCWLGELNQDSTFSRADAREALRFFRQAAKAGVDRACGWFIHELISLSMDSPEEMKHAAGLLAIQSRRGDSRAMWHLGQLALTGSLTGVDFADARQWYERAGAGNPMAVAQLALLYDNGLGVPRDPSRAFHLYRLAAMAGNANAMGSLGGMLETGEGCPRDLVAATVWYQTALPLTSVRWERAARHAIARLESRLSPAGRREAQRRLARLGQAFAPPATVSLTFRSAPP